MKWMAFAGVVLAAGLVPAAADPLAASRWKSRVLVVLAPDARDARLLAQRTIVEGATSGMKERDLVLMEAPGDTERAQAFRAKFGVLAKDFRVVLVGKDGNAAMSSPSPLSAQTLFGVIDAMPMRRDEMRRRS